MARRLLLAPPMYTGTYPPTAPRLRAQLFAAVLGVLLASFVTLLSRCAAAQPAADPFAEPPPISLDELKAPEPLRDPIARASIGMTALGVATALVGAGTWLSAEGHEVCGLTGCVTSTNEGTERDAGTALVGLGGGLAVSGAISLLVSLGKPLPPESARDDEGVAVTGLVFAELGAGLLGSALTFGGLSGDRPDFARGTPMFIASGVSGLVGMTLLIVGSDAMSPEERAAREQERNERRERKKRKRHGGGEAGAPRAVVAMPSEAIQCKPLEVSVGDKGIERAIKHLKRKMAAEGILRELKRRRHYMKPSVKRRKKASEAARRRRKRSKIPSPGSRGGPASRSGRTARTCGCWVARLGSRGPWWPDCSRRGRGSSSSHGRCSRRSARWWGLRCAMPSRRRAG
jgi:small subunit ribosomal protein S21